MLTRERLRSFLHSCFHSSDDVFLESMTSRTKANANQMWRMPNDVAHPGRMDRAMLNFIINILIGSGDTALTFAAANKRYSLYCLLLRKYMQMGDHHTAILLYKPWNHLSSNASSSSRPPRDHASLKLAVNVTEH